MATIPLWAIGRHVTAFTLTPTTLSTAGVITDTTASAVTYYGHLEDIAVDAEVDFEEISSMSARRKHNVAIQAGTGFKCTEIEKSAGSNKAAAFWAAYAGDVCKVLLTRGAQSWTGYCVAGNYNMTGNKRGVKATFQLMPIDTDEYTGSAAAVTYS